MTGRVLADSARHRIASAFLGVVVLAACTPPTTTPPVPRASTRPSLPIDVAELRTAPRVTDLAGRFAYGGTDGHIWTFDLATGVRAQVTRGRGGVDFDPHWSPDGSRLVFRTERFRPADPTGTGYNGIFVVGADGSAEHAVNPPGGGLFPEWAPDGRIVFSSPRPDGSEGLFSVRPNGKGLRDLRTYAEHVTWSPDGSQILLDRNDGIGTAQDWNIWRATAKLTQLTRLTSTAGDDHFGGWSPDGRSIAFSTTRSDEGDVWLMDSSGAGQHPLVTGPGAQSAEAWLADGRILIADYGAAKASWYVVSANGTDARSVPELMGLQGPVDWTVR